MINVKSVSKYFNNFKALDDVSFQIEKGEIVGFLGENGAGKTTLMRILTTFLPPSSGSVTVAGEDVVANSINVRKRIGYLPENPPLYSDMNVGSYLKYAAQLKDVAAKDIRKQVDRVLDECRLKAVQHSPIAHLSKGYRQRIGIAQAIIHEPDILILDEPTNGLDPVQILQVRKLIKNLEHIKTVILSTHILSEIEQIAKRVSIIKDGVVIADGAITQLLNQTDSKRQIELRIRGKKEVVLDIIRGVDGVECSSVTVNDNVLLCELQVAGSVGSFNRVVGKLINAECDLLELKEIKSGLESLFMKLVEGKSINA